jgi:predicted transcriptional regulator
VEKERLVKIVNHSYNPDRPELGRAGYCVAIGYFNEKSLKEICAYYQVSEEDALYWWEYFGFDKNKAQPERKRRTKQNDIFTYLKDHVDEEITVKKLSEDCNISNPTAYKFLGDNAGWFKKVKRGVYQVVNAEEERKNAKRS